eukprot:4349539-Pleurochrysis_carterae.AAC.2
MISSQPEGISQDRSRQWLQILSESRAQKQPPSPLQAALWSVRSLAPSFAPSFAPYFAPYFALSRCNRLTSAGAAAERKQSRRATYLICMIPGSRQSASHIRSSQIGSCREAITVGSGAVVAAFPCAAALAPRVHACACECAFSDSPADATSSTFVSDSTAAISTSASTASATSAAACACACARSATSLSTAHISLAPLSAAKSSPALCRLACACASVTCASRSTLSTHGAEGARPALSAASRCDTISVSSKASKRRRTGQEEHLATDGAAAEGNGDDDDDGGDCSLDAAKTDDHALDALWSKYDRHVARDGYERQRHGKTRGHRGELKLREISKSRERHAIEERTRSLEERHQGTKRSFGSACFWISCILDRVGVSGQHIFGRLGVIAAIVAIAAVAFEVAPTVVAACQFRQHRDGSHRIRFVKRVRKACNANGLEHEQPERNEDVHNTAIAAVATAAPLVTLCGASEAPSKLCSAL